MSYFWSASGHDSFLLLKLSKCTHLGLLVTSPYIISWNSPHTPITIYSSQLDILSRAENTHTSIELKLSGRTYLLLWVTHTYWTELKDWQSLCHYFIDLFNEHFFHFQQENCHSIWLFSLCDHSHLTVLSIDLYFENWLEINGVILMHFALYSSNVVFVTAFVVCILSTLSVGLRCIIVSVM